MINGFVRRRQMRFVKSGLLVADVILRIALFSAIAANASAQVNAVPVGTSANRYILSVQNSFPWTFDSVHVKVISSPAWVAITPADVVIDSIPANACGDAAFNFSVSDVQAGLIDSVTLLITDR